MKTPHAVLAGFAVVAGALAWSATAGRPAPTAPTAVAVVDLEGLFQTLKEAEARGEDLEKKYGPAQEELKTLQDRAAELRAALEKIPKENIEKREDLQIEIGVLEQERKTKLEFVQQRVYLDRGDNLRAMYPKVLEACAYIAEQDGWEVIIVDDSGVTLPQTRSPEQTVMSAIISRRVLYRTTRVDITAQVAQKMNTDFGR